MNTKLHRLMFHVTDQIFNFSDFYYGSTAHEAMQNEIKESSKAANMLTTSSRQLINVQTAAIASKRAKLEILPQSTASEIQMEKERLAIAVSAWNDAQGSRKEDYQMKMKFCSRLNGRGSHSASQTHRTRRSAFYDTLTRVPITARFSWVEESMRQTVFAQQNSSSGEARLDFLAHKRRLEDEELHRTVECEYKVTWELLYSHLRTVGAQDERMCTSKW